MAEKLRSVVAIEKQLTKDAQGAQIIPDYLIILFIVKDGSITGVTYVRNDCIPYI